MKATENLINQQQIKFLTMHYYYRIEKFVKKVASKYDKKNLKVLDIGAGKCSYKKLFNKASYYSTDIRQNKDNSINYVTDFNYGLKDLENNSFDYILCIQVLEHLKFPHKAFKEMNRLLKPGGKLFLSTNFIAHMHMIPNDYFRFTKYGLKLLGEENGFEVEHLAEHGGIFHVLSYTLSTLPLRIIFCKVNFWYTLYLLIFSLPIICLNLLAILLDNFDKEKRMTINYEVIYKKTSS